MEMPYMSSFIGMALAANAAGACLRYHCETCANKDFFEFCDKLGLGKLRDLINGDENYGLLDCHPDVWYSALKMLVEKGVYSGEENVPIMRMYRQGYDNLVRTSRISTSCEKFEGKRDPKNRKLCFCADCKNCIWEVDKGRYYCLEVGVPLSGKQRDEEKIKPLDHTVLEFCQYGYCNRNNRWFSASMVNMINKFYS